MSPAEARRDESWREYPWLPEDVRIESLMVIQAGKRIPEEVLGPDELLRLWQETVE